MPSLLLALHAFWRLLTGQSSTTLINKTVGVGIRNHTTTRQPPTRFSWSYLLVLFSCGRRPWPLRGDSSFYADGDLEAGQGVSEGPRDQDGDVRSKDLDSSCGGEFVNIDLNDGKPQQQRPRGTSQSREPSSFMPPNFYFPVPIPSIENSNDQQQGNPSPTPVLVLSDILDQFPLPPTSHARDILRGTSNPFLNLNLTLASLPRPLTPILDFDFNDASSSSFSSEFESMLSLSCEGSSSSSCFSASSPPATPLERFKPRTPSSPCTPRTPVSAFTPRTPVSGFTPRTPLSPCTPTTPLSAVLPAWCEYPTSNIAKREEAYRKMKLRKKMLGEEVHSAKCLRAWDGSLERSKSPVVSGGPEEDAGGGSDSDVADRGAGQGHGAKKQEQTHQKVRREASHSEKDARSDAADNRSKSESQDEAELEALCKFKILPKPIRPPLRVFIPGHKRSPPIFTLPDNPFIAEDAYADQSYITQLHDAQHKPIDISTPRVLRKSSSKSYVQLRRAMSDAKHDMSNVLRAFNEMVLGTEEDFRALFEEGESLSASLSLVSRDTTRTLDVGFVAEESFNASILPARSGSGTGNLKTSMASRLARAHSHARTRRDGGELELEETMSLTEDEFDEEKMAPEEWFDMVGLDEYYYLA